VLGGATWGAAHRAPSPLGGTAECGAEYGQGRLGEGGFGKLSLGDTTAAMLLAWEGTTGLRRPRPSQGQNGDHTRTAGSCRSSTCVIEALVRMPSGSGTVCPGSLAARFLPGTA
jgi:hypothetical protein